VAVRSDDRPLLRVRLLVDRGWACGIGGGYGYAIFFLAGGTLSWGAGTVWYAARRGYWPSLVSRRIFAAASRSREVRRRAR
jgi:hypothetical protein